MNQFIHRSNKRPPSRDRVRLIIAVAAVGTVLAAGLFATKEVEVARSLATESIATRDEDIYTGSILFMPEDGTICRQFLFDNRTGRLNDNGLVDCEGAFYQSDGAAPKRWSSARVRVISTSFRGR
jgi:hypothetical protein